MCGRYVTVTKIQEIESRFGVTTAFPELYVPSANISAGQLAPVITGDKPTELQFFQFGFTPSWASRNTYVLNARSEGDHNPDDDPSYSGAKGILSKPMFRKAIRSQRCLVIADAVIEGPKKEKLRKPFCVIRRNGQRPFALAGIWDRWLDQSTGEIIDSFAILTAAANDLMQKIGHHRCPLFLHEQDERTWLDPNTPLDVISSLMVPFPSEELNAWPISPDIRQAGNTEISLLSPTGEMVFEEKQFVLSEEIKLFGMGESMARERRQQEGDPG